MEVDEEDSMLGDVESIPTPLRESGVLAEMKYQKQ